MPVNSKQSAPRSTTAASNQASRVAFCPLPTEMVFRAENQHRRRKNAPRHSNAAMSSSSALPVRLVCHCMRLAARRGEWVNAPFTLQDATIRLTEAQVNDALDKLARRIGAACRAAPTAKTRLFLYPADVTAGESANWIAKLDLDGARSVKVNRGMLKDERADRYACINKKEPGTRLDNGTKLPPVLQREILGAWWT